MKDSTRYTHRYSITAADMDTRYRMTPSAVLLYFQDCWARYMACLNLAAFDVVKQNLLWVITEFSAWFEPQNALWSDDIDVTVWNSEMSSLRLYTDFRIHKADGTEVAHGHACWTLLDTEAHRLAPNTPLASQIPVLPEMTSLSHKKMRFPANGTPIHQTEHSVNTMDLDFNGHVNNRAYLSIAMQSADEAFMDTYAILCLTIHWQKETFLGDTLLCQLQRLPDETDDTLFKYLHTISRSDGQTAAQVYSEWVPRTVQLDVSKLAPRS